MRKLILISALLMSTLTIAQESKQARANDVASKYTLKKNGDFFRTIRGNECQITSGVENFKVSQHPKDVAVAYYKKAGDLYVLHNVAGDTSQCPKTSKNMIVGSIKKYTVVSSTKTIIVNMTLDRNGRFLAWDNKKALLELNSINTYVNNDCYGVDGKSHNSYVAFAISNSGKVTKVRGGENGIVQTVVDSSTRYADIEDFKRSNNVCK
jgi:hypothetical protein